MIDESRELRRAINDSSIADYNDSYGSVPSQNLIVMLARIEERIKSMQQTVERDRLDAKRDTQTTEEKIMQNLDSFKEDITEKISNIQNNTVRREEFEPVKKIVYGIVGFLLLGIGGLVMSIVSKAVLIAPVVGGH